jgi:hypothetical protein
MHPMRDLKSMTTHSDVCKRRGATHVFAAMFDGGIEDCVVLKHLHIVWQFA